MKMNPRSIRRDAVACSATPSRVMCRLALLFVLQVPVSASEPPLVEEGAQRRLSMQFQAVDIRTALASIAEFSGVNIVSSDSVSGYLTLRLQDVPWTVALETILQSKGLAQRRQDGVIWVAPRAEVSARERQEHEHRAALQQLEPLHMRSFQLNYAKATDVVTHLLSPSAGGGLSTNKIGRAHV